MRSHWGLKIGSCCENCYDAGRCRCFALRVMTERSSHGIRGMIPTLCYSGQPLITPRQLATIIRTKVLPMARKLKTASGAKHANRRAFRTRAVKTVLRRTARRFPELRVFPNDDRRLKKRGKEWLFDLIWWNDLCRRKGVELAVESEWNSHPDEVLYDFEKLLGIKAPLKLMIYRTTGRI